MYPSQKPHPLNPRGRTVHKSTTASIHSSQPASPTLGHSTPRVGFGRDQDQLLPSAARALATEGSAVAASARRPCSIRFRYVPSAPGAFFFFFKQKTAYEIHR